MNLYQVHDLLSRVTETTNLGALATIIRVEGSAYRREGAAMLFFEDGKQAGVLSGGCLETDIASRLPDVLGTARPSVFRFDLRAEDDLSGGQGSGCNGTVEVLVEPLTTELRYALCRVKNLLDRDAHVASIRQITNERSAGNVLFFADGETPFGYGRGGIPTAARNLVSRGCWRTRPSGIYAIPEWGGSAYVQVYHPKSRLIVLGAGPDADPLIRIATESGFAVTVWDWRPARCDSARFPSGTSVLVGRPEECLAQLRLRPSDSVVLMTHNFEHDKRLLRQLVNRELRYLGILGARERTRRLMDGDVPRWIHTPVGLAMKGDGPAEIAVSIVAELIQVKNTVSEGGFGEGDDDRSWNGSK